MLNIFKELLKKGESASDRAKGHSPEKELQVATCALLLEMAHADDEFAPEEEKQIEDLMRSHFDLSQETFNEIKELSDKEDDPMQVDVTDTDVTVTKGESKVTASKKK